MNKDDVVKKVSEILEVKYSHYDDHMSSKDYLPHMTLDSPVRVVCYPGMCPWSFAILENIDVITPTSKISEFIIKCSDIIKRNRVEISEKEEEIEKKIRKEIELLGLAKKFLIENNCKEIIKASR